MNATHITSSSSLAYRKLSAWAVLVIVLTGSLPVVASADGPFSLTVTPVVIDEKAKIRDIIHETITLTNTGTAPLELYPTINDVKDATGKQSFQYAHDASGLTDSLSNWTELSRGVINLAPGEVRSVPFVITVNRSAIPGTYHSSITFAQGNSRDQAEASVPLATVSVNLEVQADIKLAMQLVKFSSDNVVFSGDDVLFNFQLENIGNQEVQPTGNIAIYDRTGEEVATVDVNKEGETISPDQTSQLASVWNGANGFGKFKALLTVNYGGQAAAVQDTVFFWVIPWKQLLMIIIACGIAFVILALYFNRWMETRHLTKLAASGALRPEVLERMHNSPPPPIITMPSLPSLPQMPAMPYVPPPSVIVERVQAQVRHKRSVFNLFKRQGFVTMPEPLAKSIEQHAPLAYAEATVVPAGSTIDLKHMRHSTSLSASSVVPTEGHIINLKKPL